MTSDQISNEIKAAQHERARLILDADPLFRRLLDGVKTFLGDHYRNALRAAVEKHAVQFNALSPTDKSALKRTLDERLAAIPEDVELQIFHGIAWPHKPPDTGDSRVQARLNRPTFPVSSFSKVVREMRDPLKDHLVRFGMFGHDTWVVSTVAYAKNSDPVYRVAQEDYWPDSLTQAYAAYRTVAAEIEDLDKRVAQLEQEYQRALAIETWHGL